MATVTPQGTIPVQAVPSQTLNVSLNGQAVTLNIYSRGGAVYMDVICPTMLNGGLYGVLCLDSAFVIMNSYLGFVGDLAWIDTQGDDNPVYQGLGARYQLVYYL